MLHLHVRPPGVRGTPHIISEPRFLSRLITEHSSLFVFARRSAPPKVAAAHWTDSALLVSVPVDIQMSNGEVNQEAIDDFVVVSARSRRRAVFLLSFAAASYASRAPARTSR